MLYEEIVMSLEGHASTWAAESGRSNVARGTDNTSELMLGGVLQLLGNDRPLLVSVGVGVDGISGADGSSQLSLSGLVLGQTGHLGQCGASQGLLKLLELCDGSLLLGNSLGVCGQSGDLLGSRGAGDEADGGGGQSCECLQHLQTDGMD